MITGILCGFALFTVIDIVLITVAYKQANQIQNHKTLLDVLFNDMVSCKRELSDIIRDKNKKDVIDKELARYESFLRKQKSQYNKKFTDSTIKNYKKAVKHFLIYDEIQNTSMAKSAVKLFKEYCRNKVDKKFI